MLRRLLPLGVIVLAAGPFSVVHAQDAAQLGKLENELRAVETAFAQTMADRDHTAFSAFIAEEAVFFGSGVLRGRDAVAHGWARFFEGDAAPFSWEPAEVAVLESGRLGLSSGPVWDPNGHRIGTFNSVWRRGDDGAWRVVFDRGCPPCESSGEERE